MSHKPGFGSSSGTGRNKVGRTRKQSVWEGEKKTPPPPASPAKTKKKEEAAGGSEDRGGPARLMIGVTGIYVCYMYLGLVQERVNTTEYAAAPGLETEGYIQAGLPATAKFKFPLFLVACQCIFNFLFAAVLVLFVVKSPPSPSVGTVLKGFWHVSLAYVAAMFCSNFALQYINYPTQVLGKSCKMIPTMLSGVILYGKRYSTRQYIEVLAITAGLASFLLNKTKKNSGGGGEDEGTNLTGVALILASLVLDGLVSPSQEAFKSKNTVNKEQMMMFTNASAVVFATGMLVVTGQGAEGIAFLQHYPGIVPDILYFSIASAFGQLFIFFMIAQFDALTTVTVTTTRKFFTMLVTVFVNGHEVNQTQWLSVAAVFGGIASNAISKSAKTKKD